MATRREKQRVSIIGAVLTAALLGLIIGAVIFHAPGEPLPSPDDIEFVGEYDDSWGKLDPPAPRVGVTHILVSWTDANPRVTPKKPRTKDEARKLIEQIWHKYKNDVTAGNWKSLQAQYNEDTKPHEIYSIPSAQPLAKEFSACGKSTKVGFARIAETEFGFHLIRRES